MMDLKRAFKGYVLFLGGLLILQQGLLTFVPPTLWLQVPSIEVENTTVGTQPEMKVTRIIHRPFYATWVVEVEELRPDGSYTVVCAAPGENNYSPSNSLPDPLNLDWWTFPKTCTLPAGTYRLETTWRIYPSWIAVRTLTRLSNVFTVKPR